MGFQEKTVYLDTMLPYAFLRGIDPEVKKFFQMIENGETQAYTSVLTFDELAYRLILALIKDQYPGSPLDNLRTNEVKYLSEFVPPIVAQLEHLRGFPNLHVLDVPNTDLNIAFDAMVKYQLRPRDALHYAAMQQVSCLNLASNDLHFDRIPDITRFTV